MTTSTRETPKLVTAPTPEGMEKRVTLTFTEPECNALANLLNVAVLADGLRAAQHALPLFEKIRQGLEGAILVPINSGKVVTA